MGWDWLPWKAGNGYWTGHSSLYKDSERVQLVQDELTKVKNLVEPARSEAQTKLNALNTTLSNTGYTVDTGALDQVYGFIDEMIGTIQTQIQTKSDTADEYAKQSAEHPFLTGLATAGMVLSKFSEGVLSAFEDVGDGVATITAGWGSLATDALGWTHGANERVSNFIKRDLSNEIFTGINDATGITQYSLITSDSGFANLSKAGGVATGYLTMSGWLSGVGKGMSTANAGGKWVQATSKMLSSTTNANTVIAALGGYGSGMENGLQSGQTFLGAQGGALFQAGLQGLVAYGMGKLGENIDKGRQIKAKTNELNSATDELNRYLAEGDVSKATIEQAKAQVDAAQSAVDTLKSTKVGFGTNTQFQGYTDPITNRAREVGEKFGTNLAKNIGDVTGKNVVQRIGTYAGATIKTDAQAIKDVGHALKSGAGNALSAAGNVVIHPGQTIKTVGSKTVNAVTHPGQTGKAIVNAASKTPVGELVTSGAKDVVEGGVYGIARDALGVVSTNVANSVNSNATEQFRINTEMGLDKVGDTIPESQTEGDNKGYHAPSNDSGTSAEDTFTETPKTDDPTKNDVTTPTPTATYPGDNYYPTDPGGTGDDPTPTQVTPTDPITTITPTPTEPTTTQEPTQTVIETPTSEPGVASETPVSPSGGETTQHTGGEYSETGGYVGDINEEEPELEDLVEDAASSIDDIINGSKYTKIPTSSTPISKTTSGSSGSAVIPVAAGLSAAAAAGLGAKAYMDRKNNNDNGEDDIYTDDWSDEDSIEVEYDDQNNQEQYLDDDYNYQEVETEKYGARNNEELADLQ